MNREITIRLIKDLQYASFGGFELGADKTKDSLLPNQTATSRSQRQSQQVDLKDKASRCPSTTDYKRQQLILIFCFTGHLQGSEVEPVTSNN